MTTAEIFSVIDQLADMGTMYLEITGGEPLIRPDIWQILKYAKKREFAIMLHTNASLVTEDVAWQLADLYLHNVTIGIYGMSEYIYKRVTGASGAFRKVMHGVELLVKKGVRVDLNAALFRETFFQLKEFIKFRKIAGVEKFNLVFGLQHCIDRDRSEEPFRHQLTESQMEEFYRLLPDQFELLCSSRVRGRTVSLHASDLLCRNARIVLAIISDGTVTPCVGLPSNANIRKKSIKEIFKKDAVFKRLRSLRFKDAPIKCINCKEVKYCGICPLFIFSHTGNMTSTRTTKLMCYSTQVYKRIVDQLSSK